MRGGAWRVALVLAVAFLCLDDVMAKHSLHHQQQAQGVGIGDALKVMAAASVAFRVFKASSLPKLLSSRSPLVEGPLQRGEEVQSLLSVSAHESPKVDPQTLIIVGILVGIIVTYGIWKYLTSPKTDDDDEDTPPPIKRARGRRNKALDVVVKADEFLAADMKDEAVQAEWRGVDAAVGNDAIVGDIHTWVCLQRGELRSPKAKAAKPAVLGMVEALNTHVHVLVGRSVEDAAAVQISHANAARLWSNAVARAAETPDITLNNFAASLSAPTTLLTESAAHVVAQSQRCFRLPEGVPESVCTPETVREMATAFVQAHPVFRYDKSPSAVFACEVVERCGGTPECAAECASGMKFQPMEHMHPACGMSPDTPGANPSSEQDQQALEEFFKAT